MSQKGLIVVGSGALAAECVETIKCFDDLEVEGYLDDGGYENYQNNKARYGYKEEYLGTTFEYKFKESQNVLVAFSTGKKREFFQTLLGKKVNLENLIHPSVKIPDSVKMGVGNIVGQNVVIGPNVKIGDGNVFTAYSFISHDCQIDSYNFFSTAGLAGGVIVGSSNFFGIRSTVIPKIRIGDENTIQAGMVIDKNVENGSTIFYKYKESIIIIS
ncbi:hypothetical protein [Polynucleobacter sp. AP-Sving-400A-A2]|uniref:hypothetical protein n=1 Tax=Polynucleobacter sp. AP-Sving-400A-A2 TaxID=2081049 RepID=UPI001BFE5A40|nr:hypothetical protein [Polynucleobacter sp. AP-Sving-400A-A2]QWE14857.1 hypothetical protein C2758_01565 [Polynucleobacter sp. AP-Sving-400A-A2]